MAQYYPKKRRRVLRTFNFNRILAFVTVVCFAVALCLALSSVKIGAGGKSVRSRAYYTVTVGSAAGEAAAFALAEDCRAKGGAGYVLKQEGKFTVAAALYLSVSDAEKVCSNLISEGIAAEVTTLKSEKIKFKADGESPLAEAFNFCAYTLIDKLYECTLALDKREISEALALSRCSLWAAAASEKAAEAAKVKESEQETAVVFVLLGRLSEILSQAAQKSDYSVSSRLKYALCAAAEETAAASVRLKAAD